MPARRKLTYADKQEVKRRKAYHSKLLSEGRHTQARKFGPKLIGHDFGICAAMVHRICGEKKIAPFPAVDWMG